MFLFYILKNIFNVNCLLKHTVLILLFFIRFTWPSLPMLSATATAAIRATFGPAAVPAIIAQKQQQQQQQQQYRRV